MAEQVLYFYDRGQEEFLPAKIARFCIVNE